MSVNSANESGSVQLHAGRVSQGPCFGRRVLAESRRIEMRFTYDRRRGAVIEDETGIIVGPRGWADDGGTSFGFHDPASNAISIRGDNWFYFSASESASDWRVGRRRKRDLCWTTSGPGSPSGLQPGGDRPAARIRGAVRSKAGIDQRRPGGSIH